MTRLTNDMRDKIVKNALIKAGWFDAQKAIEERRYDLGEAIRVETLGGPEKAEEYRLINENAGKIYAALPPAIRQYNTQVSRGKQLNINLAGLSVTLTLRNYAEMYSGRRGIPAESLLCQQFHDLDGDQKAHTEKGELITTNVRAVVEKMTTVKRLLDAWPEAAELLPVTVEKPKSQLPALVTADLNAMFGLPTGGDA